MDENRPMRFVLLLFLLKYVGKHAKHLARYRKQRKTTKPSMLATKKNMIVFTESAYFKLF